MLHTRRTSLLDEVPLGHCCRCLRQNAAINNLITWNRAGAKAHGHVQGNFRTRSALLVEVRCSRPCARATHNNLPPRVVAQGSACIMTPSCHSLHTGPGYAATSQVPGGGDVQTPGIRRLRWHSFPKNEAFCRSIACTKVIFHHASRDDFHQPLICSLGFTHLPTREQTQAALA